MEEMKVIALPTDLVCVCWGVVWESYLESSFGKSLRSVDLAGLGSLQRISDQGLQVLLHQAAHHPDPILINTAPPTLTFVLCFVLRFPVFQLPSRLRAWTSCPSGWDIRPLPFLPDAFFLVFHFLRHVPFLSQSKSGFTLALTMQGAADRMEINHVRVEDIVPGEGSQPSKDTFSMIPLTWVLE